MVLVECVSGVNALLPSSPPLCNFHSGPRAHQPNDFSWHRTTVEQAATCWRCGSWLCPMWDSTFSPACPETGVHCDLGGTCEAGIWPLSGLLANDPLHIVSLAGLALWF